MLIYKALISNKDCDHKRVPIIIIIINIIIIIIINQALI